MFTNTKYESIKKNIDNFLKKAKAKYGSRFKYDFTYYTGNNENSYVLVKCENMV